MRVEKERVEKKCEQRRSASIKRGSREGVRVEKEGVERESREGVRIEKECK